MKRLLIAMTVLALGACGSGGGGDNKDVASLGQVAKTGTDQPEKDREKAWLDFAKCMREHGVDMPDPEVSESKGGMVMARRVGKPGEAIEDGRFKEADEACRHHIEGLGGGSRENPDPAMQDKLLEFAKCMRAQGIDMPDPEAEGGRVSIRVQSTQDKEKLDAAHKACESVAPGKFGGAGGVEPAK